MTKSLVRNAGGERRRQQGWEYSLWWRPSFSWRARSYSKSAESVPRRARGLKGNLDMEQQLRVRSYSWSALGIAGVHICR